MAVGPQGTVLPSLGLSVIGDGAELRSWVRGLTLPLAELHTCLQRALAPAPFLRAGN
jgi:hypothetical protein